MNRRRAVPITVVLLLALCAPARATLVNIRLEDSAAAKPISGRLILFCSAKLEGEPRLRDAWTSRSPVFSQEVKDWKSGQTLPFHPDRAFPKSWDKLETKKYRLQAVLRPTPTAANGPPGSDDRYSAPIIAELGPHLRNVVELSIDRRVKIKSARSGWPGAKRVSLRSALLSKFHGRDVFVRASIALPKDYDADTKKRFGCVYLVPGFDADGDQALQYAWMIGLMDQPLVLVGLDAMTGLGHHAFADSANNGPWGTALVEEFIPHLETVYRLIAAPRGRLVSGHSSGGWSSLWLQVSHPGFFGGVWSTSPDSVDFHDFCGLDLYDPKTNFYRDADGRPRPIMRRGQKVLITLPDFVRREEVFGLGGQFRSFEAVFSPCAPDGRPALLFDRETGAMDRKMIEAWRKYDIVDKLERDWKDLAPKLAGKLHVLIGEQDDFYLDGAVRRLKQSLERLGSDASVILIPGKDHGSILSTEEARGIGREMSRAAPLEP